MLKQILSFIISILIYLPGFAQIGGNNTYEFLNLPSAARIAALGGNLIAVKDGDNNLAYYNPAVINEEMAGKLALSTVAFFQGINFGYAGYARHYDSIGTFNLGIQYINYGKFQGADATGIKTGGFSAGETAIGLGYAFEQGLYSYGAKVKIISSFLADYTSFGAALDLGVTYYNPETEFVAALVVKNIGRQIKAYTPDNFEPLPFEIQIGISQRLEHLPLRIFLTAHNLQQFDIRYDDPNEIQTIIIFSDTTTNQKEKKYIADKIARHFIIGGEFYMGENLQLRVAYNYLRKQELTINTTRGLVGFSVGLGLVIKKFRIEYGRAQYSLAGSSNHFSISTNMHELVKKKAPISITPKF
ncbi:MAG: type IX secretion system protein PorQ [Bacteroidetes bacterium]|nr:type IX secretion system protein PorQ [Bacteroidota bacterium]